MGRLVAAGLLAALITGGTALGTGVASAAGPLSSCSARMVADPGTQILMSPEAVEAPIENALAPLDPLGILRPLFRQAWAAVPPVPLGTVPATGSLVVTGDAVANAVSGQLVALPVLAPVLTPLLDSVWPALAAACSVVAEPPGTTQPAPSTSGPSQPAPRQTAPGATPRQATPAPGGGGVAPEPAPAAPPPVSSTRSNVALEYPVDWRNAAPQAAGLPPDVAFKLGPGTGPAANPQAPQFGVLGKEPTIATPNQNAGSAEALDPGPSRAETGPLLLAGLLVMLVAAQWGRTWVLRHTDPDGASRSRLGLRWRSLRVPMPVLTKRD